MAARIVDLDEFLENVLALEVGNADPGVDHVDSDPPPLRLSPSRTPPVGV